MKLIEMKMEEAKTTKNNSRFKRTPKIKVTDLIQLDANDQFVIDGRKLHAFLKVKSEFRNWVKNRIAQYDFIEGVDFIAGIFLPPPSERIDYAFTISMAKELCMVEKNERGKEARLYFIECENKLKKQLDPPTVAQQLLATAQVMVEIEKRLIESEQNQIETNNRLSKVETHLSKKAEIQEALPNVKKKTLRNKLNEIIRSYPRRNPNSSFGDTWNVLYSEFYYRYNVNLKVRANNAGISTLDYAESAGFLKDLMALAIELFC